MVSPVSSTALEKRTATTEQTETMALEKTTTTEKTTDISKPINVLVDAVAAVEATEELGKEVANNIEESGDESGNADDFIGDGDGNVREVREYNANEENPNPVESESEYEEESDGTQTTEAIKLSRMFFFPSESKKKNKLGTRCLIVDAVKTLEKLKPKLSNVERIWFEEHPQIRHFFHMKRENNHKVQGKWMLLVRTAESSKRKEVWFIVNDVLIRYGLREHALIFGLNCCNYPLDYKECVGRKFVKRHFKEGEPLRLEDEKEKLVKIEPHRDRLKMTVLFFLESVVCAQIKVGKDPKNTFSWGRYSYYYMLKEISHTMDHFGGVVKANTLWPLPGFCVPLEILAFEAIPKLGIFFREPVEGVDVKCPGICKSTFKPNGMKAMSLSLINT
ncbi:hypothetical protein N665_0077s0048, partial [Sinapis alba]